MRPLKIFIIAGEASGDKLGASLIKALVKEHKQKIVFCGVGGDLMALEGFNSIFPMAQISLMGFFEILPHVFRVLGLIKKTIVKIKEFQPDIVITIDSPGFAMRVAKQIDRTHTKVVHYVAPSVWAYKPARALYMQEYYDMVLALLPFEPPYFTKIGLKCEFVGHPIIEDDWAGADPVLFREKHNIKPGAKLIGVMSGSRKGEVRRMLPIFAQAIRLFDKTNEIIWVFPAVSQELAMEIEQIILPFNIKFAIPVNEPLKINMLKSFDSAIVKSGTSSLELALAGVPMIVAYKVNALTAWVLRYVYRINTYASIVNILAKKPIIPELLQEECTPQKLARALAYLTKDRGKKQVRECKKILKVLGSADKNLPSVKAARAVLALDK